MSNKYAGGRSVTRECLTQKSNTLDPRLDLIDELLFSSAVGIQTWQFAVGDTLLPAAALTQFGGLFTNYADGNIPLPIRNDLTSALYTTTNTGTGSTAYKGVHLLSSQNVDGTTRLYIENTSILPQVVSVKIFGATSNVGMESADVSDAAGLKVVLKATSTGVYSMGTPSVRAINMAAVTNGNVVTDYEGTLAARTLTDGGTESGTLNAGTDYTYSLLLQPDATVDYVMSIASRVDTGADDVFFIRALHTQICVGSV